jgi:DNA-binding transcriptional regulator YiaG
MKNLRERCERVEVEEEVLIPTLDGKEIAERIKVKVPAWRDPVNGEIYLDDKALEKLERVKARHLGLLQPEEIKVLRHRLGLTQAGISKLLQIGEKTWTRWETGRERPSRALNVLLHALRDGKIDLSYLRGLQERHAHGHEPEAGSHLVTEAWRNLVEKHWQTLPLKDLEGLWRKLASVEKEARQPDWATSSPLAEQPAQKPFEQQPDMAFSGCHETTQCFTGSRFSGEQGDDPLVSDSEITLAA